MITNEIIRKLPGGTQRLVLQLVTARGPLTGDMLAELCDRSKNWASMTVPTARTALEPYGFTIRNDNDGRGYYIAEHKVVAAPPVVRKQAVVPSSPIASADAPPIEAPPEAAPERQPAEKVPHRRTIFRFPWGGFVDMHVVVGAIVERGSLVLQLTDGGYVRSPPHAQAEQVCEAITNAKGEMPNVVTITLPT